MENKLKFKVGDSDVNISFTPAGKLLVSLESDTTELEITVQSPTEKTTTEFIGGREKRG